MQVTSLPHIFLWACQEGERRCHAAHPALCFPEGIIRNLRDEQCSFIKHDTIDCEIQHAVFPCGRFTTHLNGFFSKESPGQDAVAGCFFREVGLRDRPEGQGREQGTCGLWCVAELRVENWYRGRCRSPSRGEPRECGLFWCWTFFFTSDLEQHCFLGLLRIFELRVS